MEARRSTHQSERARTELEDHLEEWKTTDRTRARTSRRRTPIREEQLEDLADLEDGETELASTGRGNRGSSLE